MANWIQAIGMKKGALRRTLKVKYGQKIPAGTLAKAAKRKGVTGRRARLAITLKSLSLKKKGR